MHNGISLLDDHKHVFCLLRSTSYCSCCRLLRVAQCLVRLITEPRLPTPCNRPGQGPLCNSPLCSPRNGFFSSGQRRGKKKRRLVRAVMKLLDKLGGNKRERNASLSCRDPALLDCWLDRLPATMPAHASSSTHHGQNAHSDAMILLVHSLVTSVVMD